MKATAARRLDSAEYELAGSTAPLTRQAARRGGPARGAARQAPRTPLRLVAADGRVLRPASGEPVRTNPAPATAPAPVSAPPQPAAARNAAPSPAHTPVRLTRRGRIVVTAMAALMVAAVSVVLAGGAQALGHSGAPARQRTAATIKVEVRPGQSLWTLAETYDPNADTRQVIQEIQQLNSLNTDQVQPGQVLWMPGD